VAAVAAAVAARWSVVRGRGPATGRRVEGGVWRVVCGCLVRLQN
jgi:hypothetical protein